MYFLGIDPGNKTGIVLLEYKNKKLNLIKASHITYKEVTWERVKQYFNSLNLDQYDLAYINIEYQYLGNNIKTFGSLVRTRTFYEIYFKEFFPEVKVYFVYPTQWGKQFKIGNKKRKEKKLFINTYFKSLFKQELTEDEADACGIALFNLGGYDE